MANTDEKPLGYESNGRPIWGRNADGFPVCFSRKAGKPDEDRCMSTVRYRNGRCKKHGGPSLAGIASPRFTHGRRAVTHKSLSVQVVLAYEASLDDPDQINLQNEIAILDAIIDEEVQLMRLGSSSKQIESLKNLFENYKRARKNDTKDEPYAFSELMEAIEGMQDMVAARRDVVRMIDSRRKLSDTQNKIEFRNKGLFTAAQVMQLLGAAMAAVSDEIKDQKLLDRIADRVDSIYDAQTRGATVEGALLNDNPLQLEA